MTSNSWKFPNQFRTNEIFSQKFDFVLGEHDTVGGPSKNFSKKWRRISRKCFQNSRKLIWIFLIFRILGSESNSWNYARTWARLKFWRKRFWINRINRINRRSPEQHFQELRQISEKKHIFLNIGHTTKL